MKLIHRILFTIPVALLMVLPVVGLSQQTIEGEVNIIRDSRVDQLMEKHIESNEAFGGMTGYRIQIFFDSGSNARNRANNERRRFMNLFPETNAYLMFDAPNFKVRVGNFRTRLEAERWLREIRTHFDMAYVVPSKIEHPRL